MFPHNGSVYRTHELIYGAALPHEPLFLDYGSEAYEGRFVELSDT